MKNFDSLVDIWQNQKVVPDIDYQVVITRFKKSQNNLKLKITMGLSVMILILITLIILWYNISFSYPTTHISLAIFALCSLYYIFNLVKNLSFLNNISFTETPKKHIEKLREFKIKRQLENTSHFLFYSIAMGLGFCLYFVEFFSQVNNVVIISSIIFIIFWFSFCYFYIQKVFIHRGEKVLSEMLKDLERIEQQF
jgi:hypothetical protein